MGGEWTAVTVSAPPSEDGTKSEEGAEGVWCLSDECGLICWCVVCSPKHNVHV